MESLNDVLCLMQPGVWMRSVDVYYSIQVHRLYRKCFTCYWLGKFYEYNLKPNGYAQATLLFTKILKQPLDDSYL